MRILTLEVRNIRGIKSIKLNPDGESMAIYGPNGTGKSAVVDAIDFLLTGKMTRLTGEGSKVLDLKKHGCHVDSRADLKNTVVIAKVHVGDKEATLERSIDKPKKLKITPSSMTIQVEAALKATELGQHILTRREILSYITAEAGKRAIRIMSLLNLEDIEKMRSTFVTIQNEAISEYGHSTAALQASENSIMVLLSLPHFGTENILAKINELRKKLNGKVLTEISVENFKSVLEPIPIRQVSVYANVDELTATIVALRSFFAEKDTLAHKESELKSLLEEYRKDKALAKCAAYDALIKTGLSLVSDSNICPLCGRPWDGDFQQYLTKRETETEMAKEKQSKVQEISLFLIQRLSAIRSSVATCVKGHEQFGLTIGSELNEYAAQITVWQQILSNPITNLSNGIWSSPLTDNILNTSLIETKIIGPLEHTLKLQSPTLTERQLAWDTLTKMEDRWKTFLDTSAQKNICEIYSKRATSTLETFESCRNNVLESTYEAVQDNFAALYKTVHGQDEAGFEAELSRAGAELNLEVEFYNRGKFPPQALHSEGHQDSMGLALFFALNNYLVKDDMEIIVLDDVVMSIDCGHRRGVCELLRSFQPNRQFIITTHDSAWAKQLNKQGIIKKANLAHFANWDISTGPIFELEKDLWEKLVEEVEKDDIPAAAARLRRNAECFFDDVCDQLHAQIEYKGTHQWELGDYVQAAMGAYKRYLKKAKDNTMKSGKEEKFKALETLEAGFKAIIEKSNIENWAVNENVHYNRWENFAKEDFKPVIAAYKDLFGIFSCPECKGGLSYNENKCDPPTASVSCVSGCTFWNVTERFTPPK